MNHAKKKRGVPDAMSGTPIRSVCGILCGQRKSAKLHRFQKLQKSKENTRNPKISGVVLELLTRFELVTSSLPTVAEPSIPCRTRLSGSFLSKKDAVTACLFHCFRPPVFPCGSRCGSKNTFGENGLQQVGHTLCRLNGSNHQQGCIHISEIDTSPLQDNLESP